MLFGVSNALATIQHAINIRLGRFRWRRFRLYFYDMIVFSDNVDENIVHVASVVLVMRDAELTLNLKNLRF